MMASPDDLLTTHEAAVLLGIQDGSIRNRVVMFRLTPADGTNPATWRFLRSEVEARIAATKRYDRNLKRTHDRREA